MQPSTTTCPSESKSAPAPAAKALWATSPLVVKAASSKTSSPDSKVKDRTFPLSCFKAIMRGVRTGMPASPIQRWWSEDHPGLVPFVQIITWDENDNIARAYSDASAL